MISLLRPTYHIRRDKIFHEPVRLCVARKAKRKHLSCGCAKSLLTVDRYTLRKLEEENAHVVGLVPGHGPLERSSRDFIQSFKHLSLALPDRDVDGLRRAIDVCPAPCAPDRDDEVILGGIVVGARREVTSPSDLSVH